MTDDLDDDLDDELGEPFAELEGALTVWCPYCGEPVELLVDPGGGSAQEYVEDCEVCCRPWRVSLRFARDGSPEAEVNTLD
ncbi:MAG: CPXCG motif-containing cysteine-rich protein [Gemmatimonadota bacterium]